MSRPWQSPPISRRVGGLEEEKIMQELADHISRRVGGLEGSENHR